MNEDMSLWVFSYAFHMIFWALSISSDFSTHIRMLLDNTFPDCLGNCAG